MKREHPDEEENDENHEKRKEIAQESEVCFVVTYCLLMLLLFLL
jgi:hypothetical protein